MKFLYLVVHNIKKLAYLRPFAFWTIILSIMVSTYGILFFAGYYSDSIYSQSIIPAYQIRLSIKDTATINSISDLIKDLMTIQELQEIIVNDNEETYSNNSAQELDIIGKYSKSDKERVQLGSYFQEDETDSKILISETTASFLKVDPFPINQIINYKGSTFEIEGILLYSEPAIILPINNYVTNYATTNVICKFNQNCSDCVSTLLHNYDEIILEVSSQENNYTILNLKFIPLLLQILIAFSFAFLNTCIVISFWFRLSKSQYKIYLLLGSNIFFTKALMITQSLILATIGVIGGGVIFRLTYPFLVEQEIIKDTQFQYLSLICLIMLIIFVNIVILSIRIQLTADKSGEKFYESNSHFGV